MSRIPIFYACDDNFIKYTIVSLRSMIDNASKDYLYHVYILNTNVTKEMEEEVLKLENENFEISFENVTDYLNSIVKQLPIRDYYSKTTYFRFFISEMFQDLDKAIYIDSDTIVQGDISELYNVDLKDRWVGACHEQVMIQTPEFGTYVEKVIGISRYQFFNAGIMLINCKAFRDNNVLGEFINYLNEYDFVVTQDEDYLNLICKDKVFWLEQNWNTEIFNELLYPVEEAKILHYIMTSKPWHYKDCRYNDIFFKYAKKTDVYESILEVLESYTDAERKRDEESCVRLVELAVSEINREDNFLNRLNQRRDASRVAVLKAIEEHEESGIFDEDLEQDPPSKELKPSDIEYVKRGFISNLKTKIAFHLAAKFLKKQIKEKNIIFKDIIGVQNIQNLNSGAIITCNHFSPFDSFAIEMVYRASKQKKRKFYRVIREGNYTSFPGFYGMLMKNCNTLPLSSNMETMKKFLRGVDTLLQEGHFILVYPEQSLWWNYRKPKPLKPGAFKFAAKNKVPVLPCFITMEDSRVMGPDGFYVQEYTIHIEKPIYPDLNKSVNENIKMMMEKNYEVWKEVYEKTYDMPLIYHDSKTIK